MPEVSVGEENQNTGKPKKPYIMPGLILIGTGKQKKEIFGNYGKPKFQLPAVNMEFPTVNLRPCLKRTKLN